MTPLGAGFGELRSVFHQDVAPGPGSWQRLCRWLEQASDPQIRAHQDYIEHHLLGWGDEVRRAPGSWLQSVVEGQERDWMRWARTCSLSGRGGLGGAQVAAIKNSQFWAGITRLEMWGEPMRAAQFFALIGGDGAAGPGAGEPKIVAFSGFKIRLGVGFLTKLLESSCCSTLSSLTLHRTYLGPAELDAFCNAPLSAGVHTMDLSDCRLEGSDLEVLSHAAFFRPRALRWTHNPTRLSGLELGTKGFEQLESLGWENSDGEGGVGPVCQALSAAPLRTLTLVDVSQGDLWDWGQSACSQGVRELRLEGAMPGERVLLECLGESGLFPGLESLLLDGAVGAEVTRLGEAGRLRGVTVAVTNRP